MTDTQNTTAPASLVPEIRPEVWADLEQRYRKLEDTVRHYNPSANFQQIRAAFEFAAKAHGAQMRKDGSPFITHPLAVAQIVAEELHLDSESIEAALLHDTIEDTSATHEDISRLFSPTVADLVEGVSKLTRVHYTSKEEEQMENLRKMLMAMSKDIRVILIKISDRLHNMRTMEYQTPEKQKQKSFETMEIYAPIAHRLGMQKMKWELEDLSLKYLDPISYREIVEALNEKAAQYDGFMSSIHDQITRRLREAHIDGYVYGRMKHPYSIYRKMYTQNKSLDDVYDLFAFRVIVDTVSDCYNVLGIIHDLYKPILGRFKDYIGTPKPNMYQSLHTTVVGQNGIPFEVQIRTREMHEVAEYGIAAHWKYKQNGQGAGDEGRYEWVRRLLENQEGADAEDFIHSLKVDMFADEVFVFTPRGDVINLPAGATPIDFAYNIHSAVGNHMVGAKVNGRLVPFDTRLKNGDIVEVVTSQSAHGPSRDWVKIARSSNARSKIRQWFKRERRDENIVNGRSSFESELKRCGVTLKELTAEENLPVILKKLSFKSLDDMYAAIGYGGVTSLKLIGRLREDIQRILHQHQAERQAEVPVEGQPEVPRPGTQRAGHRGGGSQQLSGEVLQVLLSCPRRRDRGLYHPWLWRLCPPEGLPQRRPRPPSAGGGGSLDQGLLGRQNTGILPHQFAGSVQGSAQSAGGYLHHPLRCQGPRILPQRPLHRRRLRSDLSGRGCIRQPAAAGCHAPAGADLRCHACYPPRRVINAPPAPHFSDSWQSVQKRIWSCLPISSHIAT